MQIIIDEDNLNRIQIQKVFESVICGFCLGLVQDNKIQLINFIKFNQFIEIQRNQISQIAIQLNQYLNQFQSNAIHNQKCLGLIIQDNSTEKEVLISLILREMKLCNSFVVLIKQEQRIKSLYYDYETKLVNQQSNSQTKLMSQIRFGQLELTIDLGFDRIDEISKQWTKHSTDFEISINDQLIGQSQWNLRVDNVFKKQNQKIFNIKIYFRNTNTFYSEGTHRLKGKLKVYLQFNSKSCLQELRQMVWNGLVDQLERFQEQEYFQLDGEQIMRDHQIHHLQIERLYKVNDQIHLKLRNDTNQYLQSIYEVQKLQLIEEDQQIDSEVQEYYNRLNQIFQNNQKVRIKKQNEIREQEQIRQQQEQERQNREKVELQQRQKEKEQIEKMERLKQIENDKKQKQTENDQEREDQKSLIKFISVLVLVMSVMYVKFNYL